MDQANEDAKTLAEYKKLLDNTDKLFEVWNKRKIISQPCHRKREIFGNRKCKWCLQKKKENPMFIINIEKKIVKLHKSWDEQGKNKESQDIDMRKEWL